MIHPISPRRVLVEQGITLVAAGEELRLSPVERVTDELIEFAVRHRAQIIAELAYRKKHPAVIRRLERDSTGATRLPPIFMN